jgi:hypothetical protein
LLTAVAVLGLGLSPMTAWAQKKAKPGAKGKVALISTSTGATVEIDNQKVGVVPLPGPMEVDPGEHSIRVHLRGWTEHLDTFTVTAGQQTDVEVDLLPVAGIVRIVTPQPGATVKVNGKVIGVTPFDQEVSVGKAELVVSLTGHKDFIQTLDIIPGRAYDLNPKLEAIPGVKLETTQVKEGGSQPAVYEQWWFWTILGLVAAGGITTAAVLGSLPQENPGPRSDFTLQVP